MSILDSDLGEFSCEFILDLDAHKVISMSEVPLDLEVCERVILYMRCGYRGSFIYMSKIGVKRPLSPTSPCPICHTFKIVMQISVSSLNHHE